MTEEKLQSNLRIFIGEKPKPTHPKQNGIPENKSLPKTKNRFGPVFLKLDRFYQYHIITLRASYNTCCNKAIDLKCVSWLQNDSHLLNKGCFLSVASVLELRLSWFLGIYLHCHVCTISSLKFSSCNTFIICMLMHVQTHLCICQLAHWQRNSVVEKEQEQKIEIWCSFSSIVTEGNEHGWIKLSWLQSSKSISVCHVLPLWLNINIISVLY